MGAWGDFFVFASPPPVRGELRAAIAAMHCRDEDEAAAEILTLASYSPDYRRRIAATAKKLAAAARAQAAAHGGVDAFLGEYGLSTREGVALMCLAEALLRIPDAGTADALIGDKLGGADWGAHLGKSKSAFVNASTWALLLGGRVIAPGDIGGGAAAAISALVRRAGEPVIRRALKAAMQIIGRQFVMGETIGGAIKRARIDAQSRFSFDMLGEAAQTAADARRYFAAYRGAIAAVGGNAKSAHPNGAMENDGVSVKLSALHPRYEFARREQNLRELLPRIQTLAADAKARGIGFCIDAEEAARLDVSLDMIDALARDPRLAGWDGLGLAVQANQKRAVAVIDFIAALAKSARRRLAVRLVKGAYWDAEIKRAQQDGLADYPVFTRKCASDVCYLACAKKLLAARGVLYPQFATHNAHTLAAVFHLAGADKSGFEFQRLHGMGEALFACAADELRIPRRVYAPVGGYEDLLAYLARRLLENGANTSFIHRLSDDKIPLEEIIADPVDALAAHRKPRRHPRIAKPRDIFMPERKSARGMNLSDEEELKTLAAQMEKAGCGEWRASPIIGGEEIRGAESVQTDPADRRRVIGHSVAADAKHAKHALDLAVSAAEKWSRADADMRAAILERAADLLEEQTAIAMAILIREGGKTVADALAEVREAADFCRYYAARARAEFSSAVTLPGVVGERNTIRLCGRGVFVCIAPWNFPLAIFTGQIAAALAAGNAVVAKPAEQTPQTAAFAIRLLHRAGIPANILHLLPGCGEVVGAALVGDSRIGGVAFTGSTETARIIYRELAGGDGAIVPLIAETGGQNAMIADNSALPEQVARDAVVSAFYSAGQRCSALRVLFAQDDIADKLADIIAGAMDEITVGNPALLQTDIGPVIDEVARKILAAHAARMDTEAKPLKQTPLSEEAQARGFFFAPRAYWLDDMARLRREVFGPILHIIRWRDIDEVIAQINNSGYGLTLGIHSRIDSFAEYICARAKVGNAYINRDIVGAVVGAQPFGGEGLSGTGPKAGGSRYLHRFAAERVISADTAAAGGNAALMTLGGES